MNVFKADNISFSRDKKELFKDINFELKSGEILAILGRNGVGKTTLLNCLMGLLPVKHGNIKLKDKNLKEYSKKELFSLISYIPQAKNNNIGLNVLDMVLLGLNVDISLMPKKEHIQRAKDMLNLIGIYHLKDRTCDNLSGGELQMVIFARALISNPLLIILDEPESNLDFKNQLLILENLERLKDKKKTIIFNTHYPQNAKILASKILILEPNSHLYGTNSLINKTQLGKSFEVKESFFDYLANID
ncbi:MULTISPECIES: ABC transporter ATP-binding protein [unclassified Campylobacter]|uniref:ABC transporter ATP-binding protein n=1 Tax=unclassified Campylobacter TaxID=2593542 RepID=UPI001237B414|nr:MULTISPECIES: ABC transporter ATP-binding protein [unclassified Campylobacter]KAA6225399.1 ABC transporter ATP-binding protein [Campylobacter sp. LR185c]KAA6227095.1 ABC transporter ATP-binding protein [Campylobacter sp. LR196d]KAA6228721.1 ABC transporter ATP-binding protein [Campylobacter sp. LR286c]KAA6229531.1 ABC transporter ATP-binding protein [Campylobacter sp. LR264d]KAA6230775.1 ABC transporter ATP-binding protein [Campylobacter sp. LR291e]